MRKTAHSVAYKQYTANELFISTLKLSNDDSSFKDINTTYCTPANLIPHFWNYKIVDTEGNPDLPCIMILSEIFGWFRNLSKSKTYYSSGKSLPELVDGKLAISYDFLSEKLNFQKERIRRNFVKLEKLGIILRDVRNIALEDGSRISQLYLSIDKKFFESCFRNPELDIRVRNPEFASFDVAVLKRTPPLGGEHISNKNKIRSMQSTFSENFSKEKQEEESNEKSKIEIESLSCIEKIETAFQNNTNKPKQLKDFYPLSKEDGNVLQSLSGRDFSLNAMNEILLDMSKRLADPSFFSKKGFIGYMVQAFKHEKRDAVAISNENFKIRANQTESEQEIQIQEKYLTELEYSLQVSPEWHLRKKLAAVLERSKAYKVLTAFKEVRIEEEGRCLLLLNKQISLSENDKNIIFSQIQATHEGVGVEGKYKKIWTLEIKMPELSKKNTNLKGNPLFPPREGYWGKIRTIFASYFEQTKGDGIDTNWLAKLDAKIDDNEKSINLMAPSQFFKDYVESNLLPQIKNAIEEGGYQLAALEC